MMMFRAIRRLTIVLLLIFAAGVSFLFAKLFSPASTNSNTSSNKANTVNSSAVSSDSEASADVDGGCLIGTSKPKTQIMASDSLPDDILYMGIAHGQQPWESSFTPSVSGVYCLTMEDYTETDSYELNIFEGKKSISFATLPGYLGQGYAEITLSKGSSYRIVLNDRVGYNTGSFSLRVHCAQCEEVKYYYED